jgi:hypothetical protein
MNEENKGLEGYAKWLIESTRIQLGYLPDDDTHDDEVEQRLKSGNKISKSKNQ